MDVELQLVQFFSRVEIIWARLDEAVRRTKAKTRLKTLADIYWRTMKGYRKIPEARKVICLAKEFATLPGKQLSTEVPSDSLYYFLRFYRHGSELLEFYRKLRGF